MQRSRARTPGPIASAIVCVWWLGAGACHRAADGVPTARVRDSAGVRIVENTVPSWDDGSAWRISDQPVLDIGSLDGSPEYEFGRAHGPVRLSDGRIAVADMQTNQISFFDAEGRFLHTAGGTGDGPGEFTQLYRLHKIAGDSLMALNPTSLTSIFDPRGEYVRRFSLEVVPSRQNIWWIGRLDPGALVAMSLIREGTRYVEPEPDSPEGVEYPRIIRPERHEFYRDTLLHFLFTMEGQLIDSVVKLPGQYMADNRTFAPNAAYALRRDAFFHSPGDVAEIRRFRLVTDSDGAPRSLRLDQIVRRPPLRDLTVTGAVEDGYRDRVREQNRERAERSPDQFDAAVAERRLLETRFPEKLPDHGNRMYADADGNLWLQDYRLREDEPFLWSVFQPDGQWLGTVETPAAFTVNEIGTDYVLGVGRDDFDVDHVRMYRICKPSNSVRC